MGDNHNEGVDIIEQIGNLLSGPDVLSYSDFKLIENVKDRLIICASIIALRDHSAVSEEERKAIEDVKEHVDKLIDIVKERG